jgi:hypothetical protein
MSTEPDVTFRAPTFDGDEADVTFRAPTFDGDEAHQ